MGAWSFSALAMVLLMKSTCVSIAGGMFVNGLGRLEREGFPGMGGKDLPVGTGDHEEIWEVWDCAPEVGCWSGMPVVLLCVSGSGDMLFFGSP